MKKIFTALIFFCAMILMTTASAANWQYVAFNPYGTWYIDSDTVIIDKNEGGEFIFHTLVKREWSESARKQAGMENLSYTVYVEEFKLQNGVRHVRVTQATNYTRDGKAYDDSEAPFDWDVMPSNSVAELLYDATYKFLIHD